MAHGGPMDHARCLFEGTAVPIKVVAYLQQGVLSGAIDSPEHLRDLLESSDRLKVTESTWAPFDGSMPSRAGEATIVIDDLAVAAGDEDLPGPVHAAFHPLRLEAGRRQGLVAGRLQRGHREPPAGLGEPLFRGPGRL